MSPQARAARIIVMAGLAVAGVRLVRADNASRCRSGNTWGGNGRGRRDFEVTCAAGRNR